MLHCLKKRGGPKRVRRLLTQPADKIIKYPQYFTILNLLSAWLNATIHDKQAFLQVSCFILQLNGKSFATDPTLRIFASNYYVWDA